EEQDAVRAALDEAVAGTPVAPAVEEVVRATTGALAAAAADLRTRADAARTAWEAARDAHTEARRVAGLVARRDALRTEHAALDAAAARHDEDVRRLALARAAAAVRPLLTGWQDACTTHAAAAKALVAAADAAPTDLLPDGGDVAALVGP